MTDRKAREFWILEDGTIEPTTNIRPFVNHIHVREVLPDEPKDFESLAKKHKYIPSLIAFPFGPDWKSLAWEMAEALTLTALEQNSSHLVHPKCFCNACKQRDVLNKWEKMK